MIEKRPNGYHINCDACPDAIYVPHVTKFIHAVEEAKSLGWINRQIDGEWHNFCCEKCYKDKKND